MADKVSETTKDTKVEFSGKASNLAQNVFTNDGNFLQRFKRAKEEADEKDSREKALKRKIDLESRIKNRGKRRKEKLAKENAAVEEESNESLEKTEELSSAAKAYLQEVNQYSEKMGLEDSSKVRPLVKK